MEQPDDEQQDRVEKLAAHKRYNMKALGRLVDSNRLTGVARPESVQPSLPRRAASSGVSEREPEDPDQLESDLVDPDLEERAPTSVDESDLSEPNVDEAIVAPGEVSEDRIDAADASPGPAPSATAIVAGVELTDPVGPDTDVDQRAATWENRVDRSGMGGLVTRTGLADQLDDPALGGREMDMPPASPLARRMLNGEIGPGGRLSNPRDVPGIVLELANDVPASVAVSVVRIDEEVEIVGDTVDSGIDPLIFSAVFSGVFRSVSPAAQVLEDGPLGAIQDVVIEGEKMDLILRPLGARYYLMVLEDRNDPQANLALTRMRMASIAPGVTAILAQQDGEV